MCNINTIHLIIYPKYAPHTHFGQWEMTEKLRLVNLWWFYLLRVIKIEMIRPINVPTIFRIIWTNRKNKYKWMVHFQWFGHKMKCMERTPVICFVGFRGHVIEFQHIAASKRTWFMIFGDELLRNSEQIYTHISIQLVWFACALVSHDRDEKN